MRPAKTTQDQDLAILDTLSNYGSLAVALDHVHDGDTFLVNIAGVPDVCGKSMPVRLAGVDAPELHDKRPTVRAIALKAEARLAELLVGSITLTDIRRDKYFRLNAGVSVTNGGQAIDTIAILLAEGLVRPYTGQGPKPWAKLGKRQAA